MRVRAHTGVSHIPRCEFLFGDRGWETACPHLLFSHHGKKHVITQFPCLSYLQKHSHVRLGVIIGPSAFCPRQSLQPTVLLHLPHRFPCFVWLGAFTTGTLHCLVLCYLLYLALFSTEHSQRSSLRSSIDVLHPLHLSRAKRERRVKQGRKGQRTRARAE